MSDRPHGEIPSPPLEGVRSGQTGARASVQAQGAMRQCPQCGMLNSGRSTVCLECGERLDSKPKVIRCRHCHQRALSNLTVCPHCGRELLPAPSRLFTWGGPVLLVAIFLVLLAGNWNGGNPVTWAATTLDRGRSALSRMSEQIEPVVSISMTPVSSAGMVDGVSLEPAGPSETTAVEPAPAETDGQLTETASQEGDAVAVAQAAPDSTGEQPATDATDEESGEEVPAVLLPTATDTPSPLPTATWTPAPTATATPTQEPATATPTATSAATATTAATATPSRQAVALVPTATPTAERVAAAAATEGTAESEDTDASTATATADATASPTPTARPTQAPTATSTLAAASYQVRAGDTLLAVALRFGVTLADLLAANDIEPGEVYALQVGETLIIPATGTGGSTADTEAPSQEPPLERYTVRSGDTAVGIAARFSVTVDALLAANDLSADDARTLRPGQELLIPRSGAEPVARTEPTATNTPAPATPTAVPATPTPSLRLDTPSLRSPENDTPISCSSANSLVWAGVPFIQEADRYIMHLGFVSGRDDAGNEDVTWILAQPVPPSRTSWETDNELCGLAPQELGRQWRWYVEVVDAAGNAVSAPSDIWGFSWN